MSSNERTDLAWLSGLLDGEGCFFAQFYPTPDGRLPLTLRAEITLRSDDRPVLEQVAGLVGGRIFDRPSRGENWNPTSKWVVSGLTECRGFLDKMGDQQLRSKKARDYATWRQIVETYAKFKKGGRGARDTNAPLIDEVKALIIQLQEGRNYSH